MSELNIKGGGLSASFTSHGAAMIDLRLEGHDRSLILAHDEISKYKSYNGYHGAIVGRYANRIRNGEFSIDQKDYLLEKNWLGKHTLHGGFSSTAYSDWQVKEHSKDSITFSTIDEQSRSGFPGTCYIEITYSLMGDQTLDVEIRAVADTQTPCSITPHPYFNLSNEKLVHQHLFEINAETYLPVDDECMPLGNIEKVEGTEFDFRKLRTLTTAKNYDHNFCISKARGELQLMVSAKANDSGIGMDVWSNETGLQFYTGSGLKADFSPYQGFCVEPQAWPDAPNNSNFPNSLIQANQPYEHMIKYVFSRTNV
ncbi:MAG: aldose epimerase family protein [Nitratireductor sp.]